MAANYLQPTNVRQKCSARLLPIVPVQTIPDSLPVNDIYACWKGKMNDDIYLQAINGRHSFLTVYLCTSY